MAISMLRPRVVLFQPLIACLQGIQRFQIHPVCLNFLSHVSFFSTKHKFFMNSKASKAVCNDPAVLNARCVDEREIHLNANYVWARGISFQRSMC